jgi:hypothetical protein
MFDEEARNAYSVSMKRNRNVESAQTPRDGIELRTLRLAMAERNLRRADLVRLTGFSPKRITNLVTGSDPSWPIRAAINKALQVKIFMKPKGIDWKRKKAKSRQAATDSIPANQGQMPRPLNRMVTADQVAHRQLVRPQD